MFLVFLEIHSCYIVKFIYITVLIWSYDVSKLYHKSVKHLLLEVNLNPPQELNLPERNILVIFKPPHVLPNSGDY